MMARLLLCCIAWAFGTTVHAQAFPTGPVKIVVSSPPGGGTDIIARLIAEKLRERWNQPVIIENRGGAAGNIGAEAVFHSPPDGYTLLLTAAQGPLVVNDMLYKMTFDPGKFVPVSLAASTPAILVVHPSVSASNVTELIALAKAHPGKLNYASQGAGNSAHLMAEFFNERAGIETVHVPYKGTAPALAGLISGDVQFLFGELATSGPHVAAGKLRVLGVGSASQSPLVPGVPAIAETLPGFLAITWWGMVAPPGTPPALATKISQDVAAALKQPDVAKKFADLSIEPIGGSPAELTAFIAKEREQWGKVIRRAGIQVN